MIYVISTIHVIVALFLILVVLLQQGKGADLSVFGGGSTQAAFGARGAATLLHKLTVAGFVLFVITTLALSLMQGRADRSSVMRAVAAQEAETLGQEAETPAPEAATPPAGEAETAPEAETGGDAGAAAAPPEAGAGETAPETPPPSSGEGEGGTGGS